MAETPGLAQQRGVRLALQIVGPVVMVVGIAIFVQGVRAVFGARDDFDGPAGADIARFLGGFLAFGIGLGITRAGFLGATSRYVAGEVSPVIRDAYAQIAEKKARSGPFCSKCGVQQDAEARFCDACGSPIG
ncbi:zinc-ribbon domain-containing protein [Nocardioides sp. MH1]|uniref:zinc-ribbon domain-containing protein n=1 Tax=Nocardioides sp. MH1 TaxID=3242490 RepID=UPI0035200BCB